MVNGRIKGQKVTKVNDSQTSHFEEGKWCQIDVEKLSMGLPIKKIDTMKSGKEDVKKKNSAPDLSGYKYIKWGRTKYVGEMEHITLQRNALQRKLWGSSK